MWIVCVVFGMLSVVIGLGKGQWRIVYSLWVAVGVSSSKMLSVMNGRQLSQLHCCEAVQSGCKDV